MSVGKADEHVRHLVKVTEGRSSLANSHGGRRLDGYRCLGVPSGVTALMGEIETLCFKVFSPQLRFPADPPLCSGRA